MDRYYEDNNWICNCDFCEVLTIQSLNHLKLQSLGSNALLSSSFAKKHIHEEEKGSVMTVCTNIHKRIFWYWNTVIQSYSLKNIKQYLAGAVG